VKGEQLLAVVFLVLGWCPAVNCAEPHMCANVNAVTDDD
jgi:hypothetical protein